MTIPSAPRPAIAVISGRAARFSSTPKSEAGRKAGFCLSFRQRGSAHG